MPPIQKTNCVRDQLSFTDGRGIQRTINFLDIPSLSRSVDLAERYINEVWIPTVVQGYQMEVHVFSVSPMVLSVITQNLGRPIPSGWWL